MSDLSPRLARLADDGWELVSGEARHVENPDTFHIPPREAREGLRKGQAAKLLFHIAGHGPDGRPASGVERMWVIVTGRAGGHFIGILENEPADPTTTLRAGAEVLFGPEHVVDIADPPPGYLEERFGRL